MSTTWINVLTNDLTGEALPGVLQVSNTGGGVDATLRDVVDGSGDAVPLKVSNRAVMLPSGAVLPYGDSSFFTAGQTGIMIPAYFYPNNPYSDTTCLRLLNLIRQYRGVVPVIVVLNPGSGPGSVWDGNYAAFIRLIQAAGGKVAGYVSTAYAGTINAARTEAAVKADIDTWLALYSATPIDTIFFDEMTNVWHNSDYVALYKRYTDYCHARNLAPVIGNPGADSPEEYFSTRTADIIVIVESGSWPTEDLLRGTADTLGGHLNYKTSLRAALVYGQATFNADNLRTVAKYVQWVYVTNDALSPNPWDSLSTHLEATFAALAMPGGLTLTNAANDAAAATAGVAVGSLYRNGSVVMVRVT
jgi:hypothetical protein